MIRLEPRLALNMPLIRCSNVFFQGRLSRHNITLLYPALPYTTIPILNYSTASGPTLHHPTLFGPTIHYPTLSGHILNYPTVSGPTLSGPTLDYHSVSDHTLHYPTLSGPTLNYPIVSGPNLHYLSLSGPTLLCPTLSGPTLNYPIRPYHTLPYSIRPYPTLPYPTLYQEIKLKSCSGLILKYCYSRIIYIRTLSHDDVLTKGSRKISFVRLPKECSKSPAPST